MISTERYMACGPPIRDEGPPVCHPERSEGSVFLRVINSASADLRSAIQTRALPDCVETGSGVRPAQ